MDFPFLHPPWPFFLYSQTQNQKNVNDQQVWEQGENLQLDKNFTEASEPTGACQETTRKSVWRPHQCKLDWLPGEPMKRNSFRAWLSVCTRQSHCYHLPDVSHSEPWSSHPCSAQTVLSTIPTARPAQDHSQSGSQVSHHRHQNDQSYCHF